MPLIGVRKIRIEELDVELNPLSGGEVYESMCNTQANIQPLWVGGEEKIYQNESRMVEQNVENLSYYGADISLSVQQLGIPLLRFLDGGEIGTGVEQNNYGRNIVASSWEGTRYVADYTFFPNANLSGATLYAINSNNPGPLSTQYTWSGNSAVTGGTGTCSSNLSIASPDSSFPVVDVETALVKNAYMREIGWTSTSGVLQYIVPTLQMPCWNYMPSTFTNTYNSPYWVIAFYSMRSRVGGDAATGSTVIADTRAKYNIVVPIGLNDSTTSSIVMLPVYQTGKLCIHITLNPDVRTLVTPGLRQEFIETDEYKLYSGPVIDLVGSDWRFTGQFTSGQTHQCYQYKTEWQYKEPVPITIAVFYYFSDSMTEEEFSSQYYFRTNGNYKASYWFTHALHPSITLQMVPPDEQIYIPWGYNDINDYYDELEVAIAPASDLDAGQYKNPIGSRQNKRNAFKMTLWADNVVGEDTSSYIKMEFPFCYADPTALLLNNRFNDHTLAIHAREQYSNLRSFIYLKETDSLTDE